jgi:hypothetical protein
LPEFEHILYVTAISITTTTAAAAAKAKTTTTNFNQHLKTQLHLSIYPPELPCRVP